MEAPPAQIRPQAGLEPPDLRLRTQALDARSRRKGHRADLRGALGAKGSKVVPGRRGEAARLLR